MFKEKYCGSSLSQYAIILALVAIVLIPGFFLVGGSISGSFSNFLANLKGDKNSISEPIQKIKTFNASKKTVNKNVTVYKSGDLGGTPDKPVKKCKDAICTVDFGEFILTGIPQDMNDYMISSGASGTTILLADIIEQITINSSIINTKVDLNLLKNLANKGHKIANIEETLEKNAKIFLEHPDQTVSSDFVGPAGHLSGGIDKTTFDLCLNQINNQLKNPVTESDKNIKAIVNLLSGEINTILKTMVNHANDVGSGIDIPVEDVEKLLEPDASITTNLDSSIICVTGNNQSQNNNCK